MTETNSEPKNPSKHGGYLRQAWLILLLSIFYGGLLAWVQITLGPIIAENKKQATYRQIPDLVKGADVGRTVEHVICGTDKKEKTVYQAFNTEGNPLGWVFPATGQGFADTIELLVALDNDLESITGLFVLNQKETPGLGNYIKDDSEFAKQFIGLNGNRPLVAVPLAENGKNQITSLTGATISSQTVCDIVNSVVTKYRQAAKDAVKNP
ncbi:MAG: FMN-binding protein [Planctomycetia bacterium]|nr:FMN-binding protein [Planctomycetia bacterium]